MATTGQLQVFNQGTSSQAAIGRIVKSGSLKIDTDNREVAGIGGQFLIRKGLTQATLTGIEVFAPDVTFLGKMIRAAIGVQVAAFPDFTWATEGGTGNIRCHKLENAQPAKMEIGCPAGGELYAKFDLWAATWTPTDVTGSHTQQTTALLGHTDNEITATIAGGSYETTEWSIEIDNGATWLNDQDGKSAGSKTDPTGVALTNEKLTASLTTQLPIPNSAFDLSSDEYVDTDALENFELVFAAANGVVGQNITFTLANMRPNGVNEELEGEGGIISYKHEFTSATAFGGLAIS